MSLERSKKITELQSQYAMEQERQQQISNRRKRGLFRRLFVLGLLAIITSSIIITTLYKQSVAIDEKLEQQNKLEEELTSLQKEEKILREEIVKLNDDEYIAKIARRDYFLSDDNEIIFNIKD
ncbi:MULTISPECIES: FtsB family cell division protein [Bacillaceae]|uniref:FtsB family cell division protein n=1 Tax=Bacillaceae TaxID=186817 RepID=UPI000BFC80E4|nr:MULTISPECIES: septum formation initiator family protein [Bacillaceae]MCM3164647.1 septum formation initiator family protein [Metabacillus litoralis]MCM3413377.1 septum formation initiator family protein [Metabacillus litoralis]PGT90944.1 cell division protein DIVIC [Bacillus sp. AFS040349]UGB31071.1 septum formation initiator family protein [Metabacillus sp. B2-18]UHA61024.1 septum formation initiator family protein [Metabacillus litoralis]